MSSSRVSTIAGCVLCGGASRRMGSDKADLRVQAKTMLEGAIGVLEPLCGEVLLASGRQARESKLRCVLDEAPGAGPLAGIVAALAACDADLLCVLACDMPGAEPKHFRRLLAEAEERALDACWFQTQGLDEPLFAVYRTTCLQPMRATLAAGDYKVIGFRQQSGPAGRPLRIGMIELSEEESACSRNVNTPEDLARERTNGLDPRTES